MKKTSLYIVGMLLLSCKQQQQPPDEFLSGSRVNISGGTTGAMIRTDSIRVYFGGEIPDNRVGVEQSLVIADEKSDFNFNASDLHRPERVSMVLYGRENGQRLTISLSEYLVEPGDSIHMNISKQQEETSVTFSGRGAQKWECRHKIDRFRRGADVFSLPETDQKSGILEVFDHSIALADSLIDIQVGMLGKYQDSISPTAYKIMEADIIGYTSKRLKTRFWKTGDTTLTTDEISALSSRMVEASRKMDLAPEIMAMSPYCLRYLSDITVAKLIDENPGQEEYYLDQVYVKRFGELCSRWIEDYTGTLREKLLLYNLQVPWAQDTYGIDQCIHKSYELVKTPSLKKIMDTWYGRKIRGAAAYNFTLPDTTGREVQLRDFRGKVVYIDIWFTGCKGCASLAERVDKLVYPKFKNHPDIVFVSISGDKNKERWLSSVREEKYGLREYVNLYTNGMGFEHPFMKYYDIQGGPTTLLIDKQGKIYSSAPPKYFDDETMSGLVSLIEEALAE